MPVYDVFGKVCGTKYLGKFTADTPEAAVEAALESEAAYVAFCCSCSSECEDPEIDSAEANLAE